MKNIYKIIIASVILLLILLGLSYTFPSLQKSPLKPNPVGNSATTSNPSQLAQANWKLYKNNSYGFEFKYPEEQFKLVPITRAFPQSSIKRSGQKLLTLDSATSIGKKDCRYGEDDTLVKCDAALELGIAFFTLDMPSNKVLAAIWPQKLTDQDLEMVLEDEEVHTTLGGYPALHYKEVLEGGGNDYYILTLSSNKSLLVDLTFNGNLEAEPATSYFDPIMKTLKLP